MDTGRREYMEKLAAGLTGVAIGGYSVSRGTDLREVRHDLLSYSGVPRSYLETGALKEELKPANEEVVDEFRPVEENILLDFLLVEDVTFELEPVERLKEDFESEGINFGYIRRPERIDRDRYQKLSHPEGVVGDPRFLRELVGIEDGLLDEETSDTMLDGAIQVFLTPETVLETSEGEINDGYAYGSKAVLSSLEHVDSYRLLKHEIGHTLGLVHSSDTVMSDDEDSTEYGKGSGRRSAETCPRPPSSRSAPRSCPAAPLAVLSRLLLAA